MFGIWYIVFIVGTCSASVPLKQTPYYTVYALSDVEIRKNLPEGVTVLQDFTKGNDRTIIEFPYNGTVPSDSGGNFGDLEFYITLQNGTLIARETIINEIYGQNILLNYYREFPGYYVEDFKLLNFGRERGWFQSATIYHTAGAVEADILIAAGNVVRIFAEVYIRES